MKIIIKTMVQSYSIAKFKYYEVYKIESKLIIKIFMQCAPFSVGVVMVLTADSF